MGITDFTRVFPKSGTVVIGKVRYSIIIVDAFLEIYRTSLGGSPLTDASGRPTGYIDLIWQLVIRLIKQSNIMIWVFDSIEKNKLKERELARRKKLRDAAEEEDDEDVSDERKEQLKRRRFTITPTMILSIKFILRSMGVMYVDAPAEYEAEHMCACFARMFETDIDKTRAFWPNLPDEIDPTVYVLTRDPDALVYGAPRILWKNRSSYDIYVLEDILGFAKDKIASYYRPERLVQVTGCDDITDAFSMEVFVQVCVALGADICPSGKVKGMGPVTVFKKIFEIEFDPGQLLAINRFLEVCPQGGKIIRRKRTTESISELMDWLVEERSFKAARVEKRMKDIKPE
jgi:5'-3' exonuclease